MPASGFVYETPWNIVPGTVGTRTSFPLGFTLAELAWIFLVSRDLRVSVNLTADAGFVGPWVEDFTLDEKPGSEFVAGNAWEQSGPTPGITPMIRKVLRSYFPAPGEAWLLHLSIAGGTSFETGGSGVVDSGGLLYPSMRLRVETQNLADAGPSLETLDPTHPASPVAVTFLGNPLPAYGQLSGTIGIDYLGPGESGFFTFGGLRSPDDGSFISPSF